MRGLDLAWAAVGLMTCAVPSASMHRLGLDWQ